MNTVTYALLRGGEVNYSGMYHTCLTDPQEIADALLAAPGGQDSDEVQVWMGAADVGDPDAVAHRDGVS